MNRSTSSSSASKVIGRARTRATTPTDQAMDSPKPKAARKDRATHAEAKSNPVALAATGTAVTSDRADIHRAKLGAAKRADRRNPNSADASEAKQTFSAVSSSTEAPALSAPTQASVRVRTERPKDAPRGSSKLAQIETLLRQEGGATIVDLMAATGWQRHSVHGVLSGTFKTKRDLALTRTRAPDGTSIYAIKSPA